MEMGRQPTLSLHGSEVLHLVAGVAPEALEPAVEEPQEVQGVEGCTAVVVVMPLLRCPGARDDLSLAIGGLLAVASVTTTSSP